MILRALGASYVLLTSCAEGASPAAAAPTPAPVRGECAALTRGNWVLESSDYVERETTLGKVFSPAPGSRRLVRDSDVTPSMFAMQGSLSTGEPASIFDAGKVSLKAGEIVEREVPGDRIAAACVTGEHARVYWTKPHDKTRSQGGRTTTEPFSTLFIQGVSAGETMLVLRLPDGTSRTISILVTDAPK